VEPDKYIYDLLFQYDCVILPDFGGFLANYRSAEINTRQNSFSPPGKNIIFNRNLVHNDGLLISYISQAEGIEYLKSKNLVFGFVRQTMKKLGKGEKVSFSGIGLFYFDMQRNLQFEPDTSTNFLLQAYGLPSFHFPAIKDFDINKKIRRSMAKTIQASPVRRKATVRKVMIGVPVLLALLFIPLKTNIFKGYYSGYSAIFPVPALSLVSNAPEEKIDQPESDSGFITTVTANVAVNPVISAVPEEKNFNKDFATEPVSTDENKLYVIAGSFRTMSSAMKGREELLAIGFSSEILEPDNGRIRLAVYSSHYRSEAIKKLAEVRKLIPDGWLLKK
jgi:nucleoid DNA-binding protein